MINTFLSSPKGEKFGPQTGVEKHESPKHPLAGPLAQVKKVWNCGEYCKKNPRKTGVSDGGQRGDRTPDTRIFSPLLYQLSYLAGHGYGLYITFLQMASIFFTFLHNFAIFLISICFAIHNLRYSSNRNIITAVHNHGCGVFSCIMRREPASARSFQICAVCRYVHRCAKISENAFMCIVWEFF